MVTFFGRLMVFFYGWKVVTARVVSASGTCVSWYAINISFIQFQYFIIPFCIQCTSWNLSFQPIWQNNVHRPLPSASFIRNRFLLRLFLISDYVLENLPFSRRLCHATVYANIIIVESSPFWEILPVAEAAKKVDTMCL